jgi:predicted RNase H-like HicB family nuclease
MRFAIVIEETAAGFSAFVPDLPGCIATGRSQSEVEVELKSAIRFHIDGLKEDGLPIPQVTSVAKHDERKGKLRYVKKLTSSTTG